MREVINIPVGPAAAPVDVSDINIAGIACTAGTGCVLYGINVPAKSDQDHYASFNGDGSTIDFSSTNIPCLANATDLDTTANTAAATLGVVVKANGDYLKRVGSDDYPATGEFVVTAGARGTAELSFTEIATDGDYITITDTASGVVKFEFDDDSSASGTAVSITGTFAQSITNLVAAINTATGISVYAADNGDNTVSLAQLAAGAAGNQDITVSMTSTGFSASTGFTGGSDTGFTLSLGNAYESTDKIEAIVGQTIGTLVSLTQNTDAESSCRPIMTAGVAAATMLLK